MSQELFIRVRGKVQGPFNREKLQALARRGQFSRLHEVSEDGANWVRASTYPELFSGMSAVPPGLVPSPSATKPVATMNDSTGSYAVTLDQDDGDSMHSTAPPASPREQSWYYSVGSTQQGPVAFAMLQMLASTGQLAQDDLVWSDGMQEWTAAGKVPGLGRTSIPSVTPGMAAAPPVPVSVNALPQVSGLAIASLVLGILGLLPLFGIGSLMAVIFGHVSLSVIHRSNGMRTGSGMAVAGLILGYLVLGPLIGYLLVMVVLLVIAAISAAGGGAAAVL